MPGARSRIRPESASGSSVSDAETSSQLEYYLQKQLEDDIARIFDESIYSDIEVVCGKLKILTHSCILKARTHTFYKKLETILHVNIDRDTFDEIYSFISDTYTECNIQHQEKEIITYLNENLDIVKFSGEVQSWNEDTGETEVFLTPKCVISPYVERNVQKSISSSPSTELTKEYYALVPIENNLLEKELKEQDALSNAFQTIIRSQTEHTCQNKIANRSKPTSLSLNSSHSSKTVKHSSSCDILSKYHINDTLTTNTSTNNKKNSLKESTSQNKNKNQVTVVNNTPGVKNCINESGVGKVTESGFSPDSLLTDDPSSSSDYLSAAYTFSPGVSSNYFPQLNVEDNNIIMDNIFTLSDSGCENTEIMESLSSHKDVTITDVSLTDRTLHEFAPDEAGNSQEYAQNLPRDKQRDNVQESSTSNSTQAAGILKNEKNGASSNKLISFKETLVCKSSKEEKQRQNEEIVIMESSSLSSETGSWESVFPSKFDEKDVCEKFIINEHQCSNGYSLTRSKGILGSHKQSDPLSTESSEGIATNKTPYKSSCFIDAASLTENDIVTETVVRESRIPLSKKQELPGPSTPLPCTSVKLDASPNEWSESNDNDDSLEQPENKDQDYIHKDSSPTIFEMTPLSEDSLSTHNFCEIKGINTAEDLTKTSSYNTDKLQASVASVTAPPFTPYNSILSLMDSSIKTYESEGSESDTTTVGHSGHLGVFSKTCNKTVSLISSESSAIEENMSPAGTYFSRSYTAPQKLDDTPIVSGRFEPSDDEIHDKQVKVSCAPTWIVNMSCTTKSKHEEKLFEDTKSIPKPYVSTDNISNKSRSSVDSDISERSSQKFYIDLSSLPDPLPPEKKIEQDVSSEKKNIFSMFIDLGEKSTLKEMPARLSSSLNHKKASNVEVKTSKNIKTALISNDLSEVKNSLISFEKIESLCNDPTISISDIIGIPESIPETNESFVSESVIKQDTVMKQKNDTHNTLRISTSAIEEEPVDDYQADLFVKLSDLDKPCQKSDISVTINEHSVLDVRMTRSIPDHNWGQPSLTSRSIEVISSFHSENALSLNRLFPHLKNEFSRSMPGSLSNRTRSPMRLGNGISTGEVEELVSDISEISSVQSSFCRSIVGNSTTEETSQTSSLVNNCQSRLGQDLLRMFLEEIAPDVIVEVSGKRIKAHKCILSSRCQYFAGILSGGWVQSAGNVIVLPTFSYNVVHFAMCHIYSGTSAIPDSVSILELATLTDMLGLEGLKEAIMFTLKVKYCHHFHRPCSVCIVGVLECFPLSSAYGLDDLYRKCLKWITKYFSKVWPTKAFATLPSELLEKCYQQHIVNLSTENLVDTVYGCGIAVASLQNNRWAEIVARMCRRLVNAAAHFVASRLTEVLRMIANMPNDAPSVAKQALNDCFAAAIEWAPPDEACRAYAYLSTIVKQTRSQNNTKPDLIVNGNQNNKVASTDLLSAHASGWRLQCEGALVRAAPRVVGTQAFQELSPDLRKRLRELGCIMYGAQAIPLSSYTVQNRRNKTVMNKNVRSQSNSANRHLVEQMRSTFVPYTSKPPTQSGSMDIMNSNNDIRDIRKPNRTNPPKIRTTKAQEERAKFNLAKTTQPERPNRQTSVVRGPSFENTKPRYLEPKFKDIHKNKSAANKICTKMLSSSESSRNSSPIQTRIMRESRLKARNVNAQAMSQDSLENCSRPRTAEPSTDSLSESQNSNKYATYTKARHIKKGSVESVKSPKCQGVNQTVSNHKVKTKIPVYLNHTDNRRTELQRRASGKALPIQQVPGTSQSRCAAKDRPFGSLMNATKSSSAKIAHKVVKDGTKSTKESKVQNKVNTAITLVVHDEARHPPELPLMERSGTFLKDEPTFADKTINKDIDQ